MISSFGKQSKLKSEILPFIALVSATYIAGMGIIKFLEYREKKALDEVRNYSKTIEYVVKENECWEQIGRKSVPKNLRNRLDSQVLSKYLAEELNKRKNYSLQKNEKVLVPVYGK